MNKRMWLAGAIKKFVDFVENHSAALLVVATVATLVLAAGLPRIRVVEQASEKLLSEDQPLVQDFNEVKNHFGSNSRTAIITIEALGKYGLTQSAGLELIKNVTDALAAVPVIRRDTLLSLATAVDIQSKDQEIVSEPLIREWPRNRQEERALQEHIKSNSFVYGRLISKDFRSALIMALTVDSATVSELYHQTSEAIRPWAKSVPGVRVQMVGDIALNYQINSGIQKDILIFAILSMLFVLVGFYLAFRSWHGVVLPFTTIFVGVVWTMGLIGWYGEPIHIISATIPVVLVVIGNACAIHVYHFLHEGVMRGLSFKASLTEFAETHFSPFAMSALTTFIGAFSLITFKLKPIQHFGLFAALGTVVAVFSSVLIIPAFYRLLFGSVRKLEDSVSQGVVRARDFVVSTIEQVPVAGKMTEVIADSVKMTVQGGVQGMIKGAQRAHLLKRVLAEFAMWVDRYPWRVLGAAAAVIAVGSYGATRIDINFDYTTMLPNGNEVKEATKRLDRDFGGTAGFDLMLDTRKSGGALEPAFLESVRQFIRAAQRDPAITQTFSVIDLLRKTQEVMNPESKSVLPESREAASQYLLLLGMSQSGLNLSNYITDDHSKLRVSFLVLGNDTAHIEKVYQRLLGLRDAYFSQETRVLFGGGQMTFLLKVRNIIWGKVQNIISSMICVFLLIICVYRSLSRGFYSLVTMPVGIAANFGLMGFAGIPLDAVTAIVTSIAMGVGTDLSIHMISAIKDYYRAGLSPGQTTSTRGLMGRAVRSAVEHRGEAMIYNAMSDVLGFSVLIFSKFFAIQAFAILMCWSLSVLQVAAILVVPAFIRIFQPEFITLHRKRNKIPESRAWRIWKWAGTGVFLAGLSTVVWIMDAWSAEAPTAQDLLKKSVQAIYVDNEESLYVMKLIGPSGDVTTRKMKVFFKGVKDRQSKLLIRFTEPSDIRGTGFLTVKETNKPGDQWLYLPAIKKSRRIRGGNRDESFLGSDFTMGDLSVDHEDGLQFAIKGIEKMDGVDCYVLEGILPAGASNAGRLYSRKKIWIRKDNSMAIRTEFYSPSGQLEKVMRLMGIKKQGSRWVADQLEMKNLVTSHATLLEFEKRESNHALSDALFTVQSLEKGR